MSCDESCWKYGEHRRLTMLFHLLFANFTIVCHLRLLQISLSVKWMLNNSQTARAPGQGRQTFRSIPAGGRKRMRNSKLLWSFLTLFSSSHLFSMPFESHRTFCPLLCIQSVTCSSFLVSILLVRLVFPLTVWLWPTSVVCQLSQF